MLHCFIQGNLQMYSFLHKNMILKVPHSNNNIDFLSQVPMKCLLTKIKTKSVERSNLLFKKTSQVYFSRIKNLKPSSAVNGTIELLMVSRRRFDPVNNLFFQKYFYKITFLCCFCVFAKSLILKLSENYRAIIQLSKITQFPRLQIYTMTLKFSKVSLLDRRSCLVASFLIFADVNKNWFIVCKLHTSHGP